MRNMHKNRKVKLEAKRSEIRNVDSWGHIGKTAIQGILDRDARQIRAKVVPNVKHETLQYEILNQVEFGAKLYTDDAFAYDQLASLYAHEVVNHKIGIRARTGSHQRHGKLLVAFKRSLHGTYVAVEPFHLDRYVDEQVFRYNNRATKGNQLNNADRFDFAMSGIIGKRLTFAELTGKNGETSVF